MHRLCMHTRQYAAGPQRRDETITEHPTEQHSKQLSYGNSWLFSGVVDCGVRKKSVCVDMTHPGSAAQPEGWCTGMAAQLALVMSQQRDEFERIERSVLDARKTCAVAGHTELVGMLEVLSRLLALAHPFYLPGVRVLCREAVAAEAADTGPEQSPRAGADCAMCAEHVQHVQCVLFEMMLRLRTPKVPGSQGCTVWVLPPVHVRRYSR